jgi:hypothetical protein
VTDSDDALGKILREVSSVRTELADMRIQSDSRHRANVNDLLEVRQMAQRALEHAADAKRIADTSAFDTRELHRAVIDNAKGVSAKQIEQAAQIDGLTKETKSQTADLKTLLDAEDARKADEVATKKLDAARWLFIDRTIKIGGPIVATIMLVGGYILTHWKP